MCQAKSTPFSLGQLIADHAKALAAEHHLCEHQWKVLNALKECRTGNLGHVLMECRECGATHEFPLSCGNRHCPRCTAPRREAWRTKQCQDLLPVPYYHLIFTLPHVLNPLIRDNRALLYNLLFDKAIEVLQQFAEQEYGGRFGITALLHTWGQALGDHYHLHLIIPGGALRPARAKGEAPTWVPARPNCLVPVKPLALCFRGAFIQGVQKLYEAGKLEFHSREMKERAEPGAFRHLMRLAVRRKWHIFAEKSKKTAKGAVNYLARYSHRVATDEKRIRKEKREDGEVELSLSYVDNRDGKGKQMRFSPVSFLKRFCLHILPPGLVRVRHYGFLANGKRKQRLAQARASIEEQGLATMPVAKENNLLEAIRICGRCQAVDALCWVRTVYRTADGRWISIVNEGLRRRARAEPGSDSS